MDEASLLRAQDEADYAFNQARILRNQLLASAPAPPPPSVSNGDRKGGLHAFLDRVQSLTPEFVRALVRPVYLSLYYRLYPEHSPRPQPPPPPPVEDGLAAHSGYAPMVQFKQRLCRGLDMDFQGVATVSQPGLVSVVLPVYNGERYLEESIRSVLAQSYPNLELIVVDDGSIDQTPAIVERYTSDARVRLIRQPNRKLPAALNAGFAAARGEFFTWTSDDNRMRTEMLAELLGFLQENAGVEMVYADEELIDEQGQPSHHAAFCEIYQTPPGGSELRRPLDAGELNFVQNNYIGGCFLYRAWAGRVCGPYDEKCFGFEDYEYWMRMNALFRVAHLGKRGPLYLYRLHPQSLTTNERAYRISERARHFMLVEEERRRFYLEGFDITFIGSHPWFPDLARIYRRAGHNVAELTRLTDDALYRHRATRAFAKSVIFSTGPTPLGESAVFHGNAVAFPDCTLSAPSATALAWPLLAAANRILWFRQEHPPTA